MHPKDIRAVVRIAGVRGAAFVGFDGQVTTHEGQISPLLHAHLVRVWQQVQNGAETEPVPSFQEIHWEGGVVLVMPTRGGLIVVETDRNVNLGMLRLKLDPLRAHLDQALEAEDAKKGALS